MNYRSGLLAALMLAGALAMGGCKNNNLFGGMRKEGSGSTATVLSDAQAALINKEYNTALSYYQTVLAREPNNSEALYGAAAASFGAAGLDMGQLMANVVNTQQNAAPAATLSAALDYAMVGAPGAVTVNADSLLYNLNLDGLRAHLNKTICFLLKIRTGRSDGSIEPDKINVLVALTVTTTLRAVLRVLDSGLVDIRKSSTGKDYTVELVGSSADINAACVSGGVVEKTLDDLVIAVQSLQTAVLKINPASDSTISEIKADIQAAFNEFKSDISNAGTYPNCATLIALPKYDVSSLQAPTADPGDCASMGTCCN